MHLAVIPEDFEGLGQRVTPVAGLSPVLEILIGIRAVLPALTVITFRLVRSRRSGGVDSSTVRVIVSALGPRSTLSRFWSRPGMSMPPRSRPGIALPTRPESRVGARPRIVVQTSRKSTLVFPAKGPSSDHWAVRAPGPFSPLENL
jgi:hypothetical protein